MARQGSLDVLKFLAAVSVVSLHAAYAGETGLALNALARFAVPVFFMLSGYFVSTHEDQPAYALRQAGKMFLYYGGASLLYLAFFGGLAALSGRWPEFISPLLASPWLILVASFMVSSLWYLVNAGWGLLILSPVLRYRVMPALAAISALFLAVGIYGENVALAAGSLPEWIFRNALFLGLPFLVLGYHARALSERLAPYPRWALAAATAVFGLGVLAERVAWIGAGYASSANISLMTVPYAVSVFLLALSFGGRSPWTDRLGTYALPVYLVHPLLSLTLPGILVPVLGLSPSGFASHPAGNTLWIAFLVVASVAIYESLKYLRALAEGLPHG